MHDIRFIRNHPDEFDKAMSRRGIQPVSSDILAVDQKRRPSRPICRKIATTQ